jgi:glutamine amidotransferase
LIVVVDLKTGNIRSITKVFERLNAKVKTTSNVEEIESANKLIIPGVGHFGKGMENLHKLNLISCLNMKVQQQKTPVLGICLGMQLFSEYSEEGNVRGLGWISAKVQRFAFPVSNHNLKVPHMGWNSVRILKDSVLLNKINNGDSFYFAHSYYVSCNSSTDVLCRTNYGVEFDAAIQMDNIYGFQFHPEKSHAKGMKIIDNFISL